MALLSKLRLSAEHEEKCREKWTQAFRLPRIEEGFLHSWERDAIAQGKGASKNDVIDRGEGGVSKKMTLCSGIDDGLTT